MLVVDDYTALLSGSYWNGIEATGTPVIVTYSFPAALPAYDASIDGFTAATVASFQSFSTAEQTQAVQALGEWAAASGLIFIQVAPGEGDINFQNIDFNTTVDTATTSSYAGFGGIGIYPFGSWNNFSYPYFSGDLDSSGEVFMNSQFQNPDGTVNYGTLLHEIGHAIGLKHPDPPLPVIDYAAQPPVVHDQVLSSDDPTRTIMATVSDVPAGTDAHILTLDQQAAAFIYGAAGTGGVYTASASGTNAVSAWSWDAATETLTQTAVTSGEEIRGSSVNDVIHGSAGADRLFGLAGDDSLDGGGGNDSLYGGTGINTLTGGTGDDAYYVDSTTTTIVENPGEGYDAVYASISFTLPDNVEALSLYGSGLTGTANDQGTSLFADGTFASHLIGGTGADYMVGGDGDDTIAGGGGTDLMYGNGGADTFVFTALTDAPVGGTLTTIGDFAEGQDRIDLSGIATSAGQALTFIGATGFHHVAGEVHQVTSGSNTILEGDIDGDGSPDFRIQLNGLVTVQSSDLLLSPPCYRAGTCILTTRGAIAVEDLMTGDCVVTASGDVCPIRWIGYRRIDCRRYPDPREVWPVRIAAGAFAENVPHRDLWLSPDHAVFVDDVLIPIKHLINGTTIGQVPADAVIYYHVELTRHDMMLAEGLAAESYLDTGNRGTFANGVGAIHLYPLFAVPKTWNGDAAAPLATSEARVRPVWERLAARSGALGKPVATMELTNDPAIHLRLGDRAIRPLVAEPNRYIFVLPSHRGPIRLASRSGYPTDSRPWADDWRRLGVYVSRIVWYDREGPRDLPVDHPALGEGWWDVEFAGHLLRRWTDGDALLPPSPNAIMVEIHLAGTIPYRLAPAEQEGRSGPLPRDAIGRRAAQAA